MQYKKCQNCGREFSQEETTVHGEKNWNAVKFCCHKCFTDYRKGKLGTLHNKEGYYIGSNGYKWIRDPNNSREWRMEHLVIVERALGRRLKKGEVVHHFNGNKLDNRNHNLMVCTASFHRWFEQHMAELYKREHFANI